MERLRDRINGWFEKNEVVWEVVMVVLAILFVVFGFLPRRPLFVNIDLGISLFFLAEFTLRFSAARSRSHYLLHHWMDVVALLPTIPAYQDASFARIVRLLRLLMILRLLGALDRITHHVRGVTAQPGLTYLLAVMTVLVLGVAGINYALEHTQNEGLSSYSSAIYWAIVTVTTTGYGDIVPKTPLGRAMGSLLMVGGLILWSLLTASIINYLTEFVGRIGRPARHVGAEPLDPVRHRPRI